MEAMRNEWSDARLDDLNDRVADMGRRMDEGFNHLHEDLHSEIGSLRSELKTEIGSVRSELHTEIGSVRSELKTGIGSVRGEIGSVRGEVGSLRSELHTEIGSVRGEIASLHRLILQVAGGMFATFTIGFAGLIATRV